MTSDRWPAGRAWAGSSTATPRRAGRVGALSRSATAEQVGGLPAMGPLHRRSDRERGTSRVTASDMELDRLFAPDYLDGVDAPSLDEVRAMRAECQEAEDGGVLPAAGGRRAGSTWSTASSTTTTRTAWATSTPLVERSARRSSDRARPGPPGHGRLPSQMSPDMEKVDLTGEIDAVLDADDIGKLPTMTEDELRSLADRLTAIEERISDQRRALHERIDALQAQIVSRYKTGEATVDGLLVPDRVRTD